MVEESDEAEYWLEVILDTDLSNNKQELQRLMNESNEISKITSKAKSSSYSK